MSREKEIVLQEIFEPGLKRALFSNFSRYTEAFLELTDNAVSNRIPGRPLKMTILVSSKSLEICNWGGYGMDIEDLRDFLKWGKIKKRKSHDIGLYSQGGKSAMGYLGKSISVITSSAGSQKEHRIEDDNLHDLRLKNYTVKTNDIEVTEGYVKIEVINLKRKLKDEELKKILIDTYRPLIENNGVIIEYNGEKLKTKKFPIESKKIDILFPTKTSRSNFKEVRGWMGYLEPRSGLKGGIRCYKLGRLICDKEFFGHPDASYKQTLNYIFGEVHLDHVTVNTNKTDFDRDSIQWEESEKIIHEKLSPFVDELLGRDIEEPSEEEKSRLKQAKDIVAELMRQRNKDLTGSSASIDISHGQKAPEPKDSFRKYESAPTSRKNQPKTPPPKNSIGRRKRTKPFMEWKIRPMEENLRSKIEINDNKQKTLVINNLFSGYKVNKGTLLYLVETAALQLALPDTDEKISPAEYILDFDELFSYFCDNFEIAKTNLKKKKIK